MSSERTTTIHSDPCPSHSAFWVSSGYCAFTWLVIGLWGNLKITVFQAIKRVGRRPQFTSETGLLCQESVWTLGFLAFKMRIFVSSPAAAVFPWVPVALTDVDVCHPLSVSKCQATFLRLHGCWAYNCRVVTVSSALPVTGNLLYLLETGVW